MDIPSPIKIHLHKYRELENRLQRVIYRAFALPETESESVKEADVVMLKREAYCLLPSKGASWKAKFKTSYENKELLEIENPQEAEQTFLRLFEFHTGKRGYNV
jgi:hypothetical protein